MESPNAVLGDVSKMGAFYAKAAGSGYTWNNSRYYGNQLYFDASRVVPTAEENRPKNIALIAQIKY